MTLPTIAVLKEADQRGLKLEAHGDELHVIPGDRVSPDFVPVLKAHKPALLPVLKLPFVMVYSKALEATIFFCEDESTKEALVEAGADEWSIYTRNELQVLVAQNRLKPLTQAELRKVHEIKRTFGAKIAE